MVVLVEVYWLCGELGRVGVGLPLFDFKQSSLCRLNSKSQNPQSNFSFHFNPFNLWRSMACTSRNRVQRTRNVTPTEILLLLLFIH